MAAATRVMTCIRMDVRLKEALAELARRERRSVSAQVEHMIETAARAAGLLEDRAQGQERPAGG